MRPRLTLILFLSSLFVTGCDISSGDMPLPQKNQIDRKALEFTCTHEPKRLPVPDPQVDEWFQEGNALFKSGIASGKDAVTAEGVRWFLKAAERGHVKAMNNLVVAYRDGEGVPQSDRKAVEWAEALIERDVGMGYYHMGAFLEQGVGVRQDRLAALTYFRKAADLGNAQGQLVAGEKTTFAVAQSPSEERARGFAVGCAMLQCAFDQGELDAGYSLGKHYQMMEAKIPEALAAFQAAAKLGHNQSLWALHTIFLEGKGGVSRDLARAECYAHLSEESDADKSRRFPDLDRICPLPPKKLPGT